MSELRIDARAPLAQLTALNFGIQFVWGAILAVSLPLRTVELGGQTALGGYAIIAAAGALVAALTQIAAGAFSDYRQAKRGNRREFYVVGIILALPLLFAFYTAPTIQGLALAFIGLQLAMNIVGGPYQAAITDYVAPTQRAAAAAWMSALQSVGAAAGLIVAGFVHAQLQAGLCLMSGLGLSFGVTYAAMHRRSAYSQTQHESDVVAQCKVPLFSRTLATLAISRGFINIGFYILLGFLAFYVRDSLQVAGIEQQRLTTAIIFLAFTVAAAVGALATARAAAHFDKRGVICVANAVIILALIGLFYAHDVRSACSAAVIAGCAWGGFVTADWALAYALLPREAMGAALGWWNVASVIPQMIAPVLAAPLILYYDARMLGLGARMIMLYAAIAFCIGSVTIWLIPQVREMHQSDSI